MGKPWGETRDQWLERTSLSQEIALWAVDSIKNSEKDIYSLEGLSRENKLKEASAKSQEIKKEIKRKITAKENGLDDLSLNTPNSYKLQVSVPSSLNYLMKAWAAAEGRDLSSVALQCLEIGLRAMKSKGSIPNAAIERYDIACEKRIALAEINNIWEKHELKNTNNNQS